MKAIITISLLLTLFTYSCEKHDDYSSNSGLEIYLTKTAHVYKSDIDYNTYNLDTVALVDTPILEYTNVISYDSSINKLTLNISDANFKTENIVQRQMFVVTMDKKPIYCCFNRFVQNPPDVVSPTVDWVYINISLNQSDNNLYISYDGDDSFDPRHNKKIIDRLKTDGKLE